ncbi:hypothetical protein H2200_001932 [Cladophialophora chaetospira]|uniref:Uncharacterized protein n=1 Tax=Cladophialophora chaetospira TaxID=386627 RepID=A0AA38XM45_9EURO|nr:hypothetical protein H2200_001932 [Cladophialophora chaetospira]
MPFDNNGNPFEYISITTLEATSEPIIQPLSRYYGFNRRLVYPMPHPYGAIGEARPLNRLPINTGPRPGAPGKQWVWRPSGEQPSLEIDQTSNEFEKAVADASQSTTYHGYDGAEELPSDPDETSPATEDSIPVRQHNSHAIEGQTMTAPAGREEEEATTAEAQSGQEETESVGLIRPVFGSSTPIPSHYWSQYWPLDGHQTPNLEISSKPRISLVPKNNTKPKVRLPPAEDSQSQALPQPDSPRCSAQSDHIHTIRPSCHACVFIATLASASKSLAASIAQDAIKLETKTDQPNHAQSVCPTDYGLPDFDNPTNTSVDDVLPWLRGFLRPSVVKLPEISAEVDRLQRMAKLKEEVVERKRLEATQGPEDYC